MKILIADDHPIVRSGLKQIIAEGQRNAVIGEASHAHETLKRVREQDWDALVLDISMPGKNGLDVLKEVKLIRPKLPVLILSAHSEDQYALRALKAGAAGYLTKETAAEYLVEAIRKVMSGGKYISPTLAEKLVIGLGANIEKPPEELLSDREYAVMQLIASGQTISEIARDLSLSVKTISTYRTRILEKMRMKTNAELTRYVIEKGLSN